MPILRIRFNGGPLHGTIGNEQIDAPSAAGEDVAIYTSNPLIGYYKVVPERLHHSDGADYSATWVPFD